MLAAPWHLLRPSTWGWKTRLALAVSAHLALAHALAAWGLVQGMPPAPWGDEVRHTGLLMGDVLVIVWFPWCDLPADAAWPAPLARWLWLMLGMGLAGYWVLGVWRVRLKRWLAARNGGLALVLGRTPFAEAMAEVWREAGREVIVVADADARGMAARKGVGFVAAAALKDATLARAGLGEARGAICADGDDAANVEAGLALAEWSSINRDALRLPLQLWVRVENPALRAACAERFGPLVQSGRLALGVFSAAQIAVRALLRDHGADFWRPGLAAAPCIWVIGLGHVAHELAAQIMQLGRMRHGLRPRLLLVDVAPEPFRAAFLARWPGAEAVADLEFRAIGQCAEDDIRTLWSLTGRASSLCFCADDESANLAAMMNIVAMFEALAEPLPPLHVYTSRQGSDRRWASLTSHPWVRRFGADDEIARELLAGERLDDLARCIHEDYVTRAMANGERPGARRSLQHWPGLPPDLKDDNRLVADHHYVKLLDIGCVWTHKGSRQHVLRLREDELEVLSRVEHERWLAQRLLAGWRQGVPRDDVRRIHPDMIAWEALSEDRRELDRNVVRQLPGLLAEAGYAVLRQCPVWVRCAATEAVPSPQFDASVQRVLDELCARAVDGALWLWLEPTSRLACRVAEICLQRKLPLGILLTKPLPMLLQGLDPDFALRMQVALHRVGRVLCVTESEMASFADACVGTLRVDADEAHLERSEQAEWA